MSELNDDRYVRATTLAGLEENLRGYGVDLVGLLKEVNIDTNALVDSSMLISIVSYNKLLNILEERTGRVNIGLELVIANKQALDNVGPLALVLKLGDTTGECVENALKYLRYHTNGINIEILKYPNQGIAEFRYTPLPPLHNVRQLAENAIGIACTAMRFLVSSEKQNPLRVTFQHRQPKDTKLHEEFLACPIEFNQPTNSMFFDLALLEMETLGSDNQVADVIYSYLDSEIDKLEADLSLESSVAAMIGQLLPTGRYSIDLIATGLAVQPKTLQRRLRDDGTSYSSILEKVRTDTATRLLRETGIPVTTVAGLCGYSNPAAFNLAFRKWYDSTPGQYRSDIAQQ